MTEAEKIIEVLDKMADKPGQLHSMEWTQEILVLNQLAALRGSVDAIAEHITQSAKRFGTTPDFLRHEMDLALNNIQNKPIEEQIDAVTPQSETKEIKDICDHLAVLSDELKADKMAQRLAQRSGTQIAKIRKMVSEARKAAAAAGKEFLAAHEASKPEREALVQLEHPNLATHLKGLTSFVFLTDQLYRYEDGVYRADGAIWAQREIKRRIEQVADDAEAKAKASGEKLDTTPILARFTEDLVAKVLYDLSTDTYIKSEQANNRLDLINVRNGLLDWAKGELLPHDPTVISTVQFPVMFDPQATCPVTDKFWSEVLPSDALGLMEEWFGYCLIPTTQFQMAAMFIGSGANGKSKMIDQLQALLGQENYETKALQELEDDRFAVADLFGRLLNCYADISHESLRSTAKFKTIVSGDEISGQRKHQHPFKFRPFARLLFSANNPPRSSDNSWGFWRKWLTITFPYTIPEGKQDDKLIQKITTPEELSGLLNRAVVGLRRLWERGRFERPASVQATLDAYRALSDPVLEFLDECTVRAPRAEVSKRALYDAYLQWCQGTGHAHPKSSPTFHAHFKELTRFREQKIGPGGKGAHGYKGIGFLVEDGVANLPGESGVADEGPLALPLDDPPVESEEGETETTIMIKAGDLF